DGNLGSAVVDRLIAEKETVFGLYARKEKAEKEERAIHKKAANLMDAEEAASSVEEMKTALGSINGAVLTVGGFATGNIQTTSLGDIHKQIALNFDTAYNLIKPLIESMERRGSIFLIGARPALNAHELKDKLAYGLAKNLLFTLAEVINAEQKNTGIHCSVIVPSIIDTPPNRKSMPDADFSEWVTPVEIADSIYYYLTHPYIKEGVIKVYGEV
ncbi:MAG: NAD(P)-dependent dehydrogenase (short-subunit alcohol dehydrogenase family), partial [Marivirga sp.]